MPVDGANAPRNWVASPNGDIGRMAGIPLTGMYFTTSANQGVHCDKWGEINWAKVGPVPVNTPLGELVGLGGDDALAFLAGDGKFYVSHDGGKTWRVERDAS